MTKRNFKPPGLQHRNKWSENFHEFLKFALQKEPKRRPTAAELLKVGYDCMMQGLCYCGHRVDGGAWIMLGGNP